MARWCVVIAWLGAAACMAEAPPPPVVDQASAAQALATALADDGACNALVRALRDGPIAWPDAAALVGIPAGEADGEVSLRDGAGEPLVAYAPDGRERDWTAVPGFRRGGEAIALDPRRAPAAPVIVIAKRHAHKQEIAEANLALQRAGLQHLPALAAASIETSRLDAIRLVDDEEPWISGAAEIYAVVSGVVGANQPEVHIVDMPYLDNDGTTYAPRQIVIDWSGFQYRVANVQLFEHDDNTSYQQLVMVLISAIGEAGTLAGHPTIMAVTEIANRILAAIPASVFTNDDDYVDSFYTLEQGHAYTGLVGAARNATVTLVPFVVQSN
jgi:hypothetical protein